MSAIKDRANAERLAAVVSGLTSLAGGASTWYALGALNRVIIDMADGYLLVTAISTGSVLGVIADRSANLGTVAYEMTLFANRAGAALTPAADRRAEERRPVVTEAAGRTDDGPDASGGSDPSGGSASGRGRPSAPVRPDRRPRARRPLRPFVLTAGRVAGGRPAASAWRPR